MKQIAILYTVKSVLASFEQQLRKAYPGELRVHNLLDEFLASDANLRGSFTKINLNRLFNDLQSLEWTGADLIVVTCSTLTPWVEKLRPLISVPVIAIDDEMARQAVTYGEKLTIMATAQSTVEPTRRKLLAEAQKAGKSLSISTLVCDEAYDAIRRLDAQTHDRLLKEQALTIKNQNVVVLAQASMAHLEPEIEKICGCPVLSTPSRCIAQVVRLLTEGESAS